MTLFWVYISRCESGNISGGYSMDETNGAGRLTFGARELTVVLLDSPHDLCMCRANRSTLNFVQDAGLTITGVHS